MTFIRGRPQRASTIGLMARSPFSIPGRRRDGLSIVIAAALIYLQLQCGVPVQNVGEETPKDRNDSSTAEVSRLEDVRLEFSCDRAELLPGQCAELRLDALNPFRHPVRWDKDWVFEQQGATPPLPESFPRSDLELSPGMTTNLVSIRLCYTDLRPGTYRYRISAAPTSDERLRSNWVTLRVLP